jgi:uncharacterized protein YjbI with pentapeptide repeats
MHPFRSDLVMLEPRGNIEMAKKDEGISITCPRNDGAVMAPGKYTVPIKIDLIAKTDSTNIRLLFGEGAAIFNWERNEHELRVHDPVNRDFRYGVGGKGKIPINEFVHISWILDQDYMLLYVNRELRLFRKNAPYMKIKDEGLPFPELEIGVASAMGSVVIIKELNITEWKHTDHSNEPLALIIPNQVHVIEGDSITVESSIFPDTALNKNVNWISDNKNITITDLGDGKLKITGVEKGLVELKGITEAGNVSKVCQVEVLDPSFMYVIDKRDPKQKIVVKNSNIAGSEFTNCYAGDSVFEDISLPNLKIQYADLKNCHFNDLNMVNGKITDANLSYLRVEGAQWGGAYFRNVGLSKENSNPAQFSNCNFRNSTITDCNFTNAKLDNCKLEGLTINGVPIEKLLELYYSLNRD